ncbi:MAG: head-tail connector protein [Caulobacteraceae bacterium]
MDGDLTTLAAVKAWLPDMASVTTSDALLGQLITAASRFICNYTGRPSFDITDYTEDYEAHGHAVILLRQWPVVGVASLTREAGPITAGYHLEPPLPGGGNQRLSLSHGVFPHGRITIAYSAGYAATPPDVAQAAIELVGERFKTRDRIGQTAKTLGGQETTAFSTAALSPTVTALLAPYRRVIPC